MLYAVNVSRIAEPISTCQAQPAFEAYAFDTLNFSRDRTTK